MILYHGSYLEVSEPDLEHSRSSLDFGRGFYTTPIYNHAKNWARRLKKRTKKGFVSTYQIDDNAFEELNCLIFDSYSEAWFDFVSNCRKNNDIYDYDIVIGNIADDAIFDTIEYYLNGMKSKEDAIKDMEFREPNQQVCFRTLAALSRLVFLGGESV